MGPLRLIRGATRKNLALNGKPAYGAHDQKHGGDKKNQNARHDRHSRIDSVSKD
jgi:hypothetical protein